MSAVKISPIGNSAGIRLSRDMLRHLRADVGDTLYLVETADGYRLTPHDPAFADQMEVARRLMRSRRAALHELAK
jgi:putative addiction module antidote